MCPPIPCKLRKISEYGYMIPTWNPDKVRSGRYSGSSYCGLGSGEYVVLAYIDGEFSQYCNQGMTDEEIIMGCIAHLNTPPPRKKYAKKAPKAPYGNLNLVNYQRKEEAGRSVYYVVAMTTDQKKNKNFWGQGHSR